MKKIIYCPHCGEENNKDDKTCKKCQARLHLKDHPWIEYFLEEVKDEVKGNFMDWLVFFLKKYFYGILITVSVAFSGVSLVTSAPEPKATYEVTTEPKTFEKMSWDEYLVGCWKITDGLQPYLHENTKIIRYDSSINLYEEMEIVINEYTLEDGTSERNVMIEAPEYASYTGTVESYGLDSFAWAPFNSNITTKYQRTSCETINENSQTYYVLTQEEWDRYYNEM